MCICTYEKLVPPALLCWCCTWQLFLKRSCMPHGELGCWALWGSHEKEAEPQPSFLVSSFQRKTIQGWWCPIVLPVPCTGAAMKQRQIPNHRSAASSSLCWPPVTHRAIMWHNCWTTAGEGLFFSSQHTSGTWATRHCSHLWNREKPRESRGFFLESPGFYSRANKELWHWGCSSALSQTSRDCRLLAFISGCLWNIPAWEPSAKTAQWAKSELRDTEGPVLQYACFQPGGSVWCKISPHIA